jgi:hypothetical protein
LKTDLADFSRRTHFNSFITAAVVPDTDVDAAPPEKDGIVLAAEVLVEGVAEDAAEDADDDAVEGTDESVEE